MTPTTHNRGTPITAGTSGLSIKKVYLKNNKVTPYLRGPIPLMFIQEADRLGGVALLVGLAIWHYRSLKKQLTFPLSLKQIAKFTAASEARNRRGLRALVSGGLIRCEYRIGKSPVLTVPAKWSLTSGGFK